MKRLLFALFPLFLLCLFMVVRVSAQCEPYNCPSLPSPINSSSNLSPLCIAGTPSACSVSNRPGFLIKGNKSNTYYFTPKYGDLTKCNTVANPVDSLNAFTLVYNPATQTFSWNVSNAIAIEVVIVKGGPNANVYNYTGTGRMADGNLHAPVNPLTCKFYEVEQIEISYRYQISVTRTLATTFTRKYNWSISQAVSTNDWRLFSGDKAVSRYSVAVDQTKTDDSNWGINGTVTIANNTPYTTQVLSILDSLQPGAQPIPLNCGGSVFTLAPGAKIQCAYNMPLSDGKNRNAVLTVNTLGSVRSRTLSTPVAFTTPTTNVNAVVSVKDNFGQTWSNIKKDTAWMYDRNFSCANAGVVTNATTLVETGQSAATSVNIQCYNLQVNMSSTPVFDREWNWDIAQSSNTVDALLLAPGQQYASAFTATLESSAQDLLLAKGTLTLQNPHPSRMALLTNVSTLVAPSTIATVTCPSSSIPAGGSIICTYQATVSDNAPKTATTAVNLQNYTFGVTGSSQPSGGTRFNGNTNVVFPASPNEINECVTVYDSVGGDVLIIGTLCAADALKKLIYERSIGPFDDPADCNLTNATIPVFFRGNDTPIGGMASWTTDLKVACQDGCTLSAAYWQTHGAYGPALYDDNWSNLGDQDGDGQKEYEEENFFLSGKSYNQTLLTQPQGNAYWVLAHTYIAAELNLLNGSAPGAVQTSFNAAKVLLQLYTPVQAPLLPNNIRKQFTILANILDRYNIGLTGPGKCSEEGEETAAKPSAESEQRESLIPANATTFGIYPNPARSYAQIQLSGLSGATAQLTVFNALGKSVLSQQLTLVDGQAHWTLAMGSTGFAPGYYHLAVQHDAGLLSKVLILAGE